MFGSKKKTYVSSSLYNMAGDPTGKPSFKRTALAGAIVRGSDIAADLRHSYLTGFAISLRSFGRWAETSGYNQRIGMAKSEVLLQSGFSTAAVQRYLQALAPAGETIEVLQAGAGGADIHLWADRYMVENYLTGDHGVWRDEVPYDYDFDANTSTLAVIIGAAPAEGAADTRPRVSVPVTDFDPLAHYVYAVYRGNTSGTVTGSIGGSWVTINGITASEPNISGWTLTSGFQNRATPVTLRTLTTVSRKSATGAVTTSPATESTRTENIAVTQDVWQRTVYIGGTKTNTLDLENEIQVTERDFSYQIVQKPTVTITQEPNPALPGTRFTVTTTVVRDELVVMKRYRASSTRETTRRYGPMKMLIYQIGTGAAELDALIQRTTGDVDWVPFIPVRLENKFITELPGDDLAVWARKAYKKAFGRRVKYDDVVEMLKDNESINDIDFAHIAFGVSLNTRSQWGRSYIYEYLRQLSAAGGQTKAKYDAHQAQKKAHYTYAKEMQGWNTSQEISWGVAQEQPVKVDMPVAPKGAITFRSNNPSLHFRQEMEFTFLFEETGVGRLMVDGKPAQVGHYWWSEVTDDEEPVPLVDNRSGYNDGDDVSRSSLLNQYNSKVALNWQESSRVWKRMVIHNAIHHNYAYGNHTVKTYVKDALADTDESGFFFPLNMAVFRQMGVVDGTEMNNCSAYLILNSYQVVKKKWYQTGLFQIIVIIVIIVVSYFYPPASGAAGGVLGTNTFVGGAILGAGASAAMIALVGAVANAVAGAILGAILSRVAGKVLGNSILGQVIAAVAVVMIGSYQTASTSGASSLSFSESFGSLMKAENLMKLGMDAIGGYTQYIQQATMHTLQETQQMVEAYSAETRRIQEMYVEQFGAGKVIDPMAFTSAGQGKVESSDTFLSRTLMTGMDIAETTHQMLSDFASLTLTLDMKV